MLAKRIKTLAARIRERLRFGDPRLEAFDKYLDPTGWVWLPETVLDHLADETTFLWSFERWMSGLSEAATAGEAPTAEVLAELAADATQMQKLVNAGMHLTEARRGPETTSFIFRR